MKEKIEIMTEECQREKDLVHSLQKDYVIQDNELKHCKDVNLIQKSMVEMLNYDIDCAKNKMKHLEAMKDFSD